MQHGVVRHHRVVATSGASTLTMIALDGQRVAQEITRTVRAAVARRSTPPHFHCLLVGDDPASRLYIRRKDAAAHDLGIAFTLHSLPASASPEMVEGTIDELNSLPDGYIVQLPLPSHLRSVTDALVNRIAPERDVDGLTEASRQRFLDGQSGATAPTPVAAVLALLATIDAELSIASLVPAAARLTGGHLASLVGKTALVVSDGDVFGPTLAVALQRAGLKQGVVFRSDDPDLPEALATSDLVVTAVGKPAFLKGDQCKPGVVLIDVGTTLVAGKTVGDVEWASMQPIAAVATPVPGGVGPVTVAMLYAKLIDLMEML